MTPTTKTPETLRPKVEPRPSFITPEMIEKNPALEVAGLFAGDPLWQKLREEIQRNRVRQGNVQAITKELIGPDFALDETAAVQEALEASRQGKYRSASDFFAEHRKQRPEPR